MARCGTGEPRVRPLIVLFGEGMIEERADAAFAWGGDVVNTAARFESAAHPGEILMSEDTYNALADKTEFYARFDREVSLKGKSNPFKAYIVFWDPKEIEIDRARPLAAAKPSTPLWKIAAFVGIPLLAILVAAVYITAGGKFGAETTRSINYSVPSK